MAKFVHNFDVEKGMNQRYVSKCIFPCLQWIRMRRSKREKQKTDVWPWIKKIQSRVQKKLKCKSIQSAEKKKARYSAISNWWLRKKQDHLKIVLTSNTANYKDIQQNSFFLFSKLTEVWLKDGPTRKNEEQEI